MTVQFLVEEFNPEGVDAAMEGVSLHPRQTIHIRVGETVYRFVRDRDGMSIGGFDFMPLPFAAIGDIETSTGDAATGTTIALDAAHLVEPTGDLTLQAYENIIDMNLRNAAMQIGLIMLDPATQQPIGLAADFVGLIDGTSFKRGTNGDGPVLVVDCLSFMSVAHRLTARVYSHEDQIELHPGDGGFRQLADTAARNGSYTWNGKDAGSGGSVSGGSYTGGGGGRNFDAGRYYDQR